MWCGRKFPGGREFVFPSCLKVLCHNFVDGWPRTGQRVRKIQRSRRTTAHERSQGPPPTPIRARPGSAAGYTSLIAEWTEIEKDVELFGPNLAAALQLIAERALALTWATGSAIALRTDDNSSDLICEARAGNDSPELGAVLDADSGFSGECVRSVSTLICNDTETDPRVDSESCRALGIGSIVACPISIYKNQVIGILEVFSPEPTAFWDNDARTLERLARIISSAVSRSIRPMPIPPSIDHAEKKPEVKPEPVPSRSLQEEIFLGLSTRARRAIVFTCGILTVVFSAWLVAPWVSDAISRLDSPPASQAAETVAASADYLGMKVTDLDNLARQNNSDAQYALGIKFASGDGTVQDYHQGLAWFLKAADNGNSRAAAKIAACFWAGRGTTKDYSRAYFWGLLAQAAGDETGRVIVINSSPHLSDRQRFAEQQEADVWLRSHHLGSISSRASR